MTITTATAEIPGGYAPAYFKQDPQIEELLRTEDLKDGMIVLVESMFSRDDPKEAEGPDANPWVVERLEKYQTWRMVTKIQESRNNIISWVGVAADGSAKSMQYGRGHFFFVKKASFEPQLYTTALEDLAKIIAQETSGVTGAIPEQEDLDLADKFVKTINAQ
jgi:hypothetical protein